ncbi:RING finger protein 122 isoform X2 [Chanodichthys erythropterus]|uniref:RING finger protein 122 isoform X2 n=1 Tax=Chanodichthys erythropterus TaxID=933992 RepID=UPI00351ED0FE
MCSSSNMEKTDKNSGLNPQDLSSDGRADAPQPKGILQSWPLAGSWMRRKVIGHLSETLMAVCSTPSSPLRPGVPGMVPLLKFLLTVKKDELSLRHPCTKVVFKDETTRLHTHGLTCAVCLEDFRTKDELGVLPCQHSFHKRCLVKWLEVRCSCPMCNDNPISAALGQTHSPGNLLDELL